MSFQQSYERNGAGHSGAIVFYCICLQPAIKGAGGQMPLDSEQYFFMEERKKEFPNCNENALRGMKRNECALF